MPNAYLQICHRLHRDAGIDFGKTSVERGNLRINGEGRPRQRSEAEVIEEIRIWGAVVGIGEVHIAKRVEFKPGDSQIVAACFQPIANTETPDGPTVDRIDGGKLRKIDRA